MHGHDGIHVSQVKNSFIIQTHCRGLHSTNETIPVGADLSEIWVQDTRNFRD
jgi:hypothetical protein